MVHLDLLEAKLAELPQKLEAFVQNQRVLKKNELYELLEERFSVKGSDKKLIMFFLQKFEFVRRVKREKHVFYIIGEKKNEKAEAVEMNVRIMEMGLQKLEQKKFSLGTQIKDLMRKVKSSTDKQAIRRMKMECVAKAKAVNSMKAKIILLQKRIDQSKSVMDDVKMMEIIEETQLDTGMLEEAKEIIQDGIDIQREIDLQTSEINQIVTQGNEGQEDLEDIFNALGSEGETNANFDKILQQSKVKVRSKVREEVIKSGEKRKTELEVAGFATTPNLEKELLESKESAAEKKIFGIEDIKRYQEANFGKQEEAGRNKVVSNERVLVFNGKQNGLRKVEQAGASFGEYQKKKQSREKAVEERLELQAENEVMDFEDTFKGTHKQSSSARGLSEFTLNKTVSNLDQKPEQKNTLSTMEQKATSNITYENRKAMSQEGADSQGGFFSKMKNKFLGSGKKTAQASHSEKEKASEPRMSPIPTENDYAVNFYDSKNTESKLRKEDEKAICRKDSKKESNVDCKLEQTMDEIRKPNDISVINLTKKEDKNKALSFQSPSKKDAEAEKESKPVQSKRKSTGKDMSFNMWGKNSIKMLKKDVQ